MNVSLRDFLPEDIPMHAGWVAGGDLGQFMSRRAPRSFAAGRWNAELTCWQVIVADGRDVGCVWLELSAPDERVADLGIFLGPAEVRGHGIGGQAIELAQRVAAERWGLETVRLRVREGNLRAIACYLAAGFVPTGRGEKIVAGERIYIVDMEHNWNE